jgi:K+-transporting ATPase KdpF subunit
MRQAAVGGAMTLIYWIGGIVVLALFIYLFVALLKPEKFS